jgi:hypothetical protein
MIRTLKKKKILNSLSILKIKIKQAPGIINVYIYIKKINIYLLLNIKI